MNIPKTWFLRHRLPHEVEMQGEGYELSLEGQDDLRALGAEVVVGEYKLVAVHNLPPAKKAEPVEDPRPSYDPMSVWAWDCSNYPVKPKE